MINHCLTKEEGLQRANISLTFRQVCQFDLTNKLFKFYALTKQSISINFCVFFYCFITKGGIKQPTPVDIKCTPESDVEVTLGLGSVSFNCEIPDEVESIDIYSSEFVAGLPTNSTFLNPSLMDSAIEAGLLEDLSKNGPPQLVEIEESAIDYDDVSEGLLEITLPLGSLNKDIIKKDKTFEIFFKYPFGVYIAFNIESVTDTTFTLLGEIHGKIENQPLVFEQSIITIDGVEAFVMPGFSTKEITTEGFYGEKDDEEEEEKEKDKEGEEQPEQEKEAEQTDADKAPSTTPVTSQPTTNAKATEQESTSGTTEGTSQPTNSTEVDIPITEEQAEEIAKIYISFRQVNSYSFTPGTITFYFLGLTTQSLPSDCSITLSTNLITLEGPEDKPTNFACQISEAVTVSKGENKQAKFKCQNNALNTSKEYTSLKLVASEDIAGIPTEDDTAINPKLTDDAITNNEIKNCTDATVPPSFTVGSIDIQGCANDGKFTITGNLSEEKSITSTFTLPLTYPEGITLTCSFVNNTIQCIADKELTGSLVMEQTIVSNGDEELFILKNFTYDSMNCINGLKKQAENKTDVSVSFRQVSHISRISNGLGFFFAGFVNSNLPASQQITMNVIVIIKGQSVAKTAQCTLRNAVTYTEGTQTQGDFDCVVTLESGEDVDPKNLTISTNNENIGGCSDLTTEEASPSLTDEAISKASEAESELGMTVDYSIAENKNICPPIFTLTSINMDKCSKKGILKVIGQFSEAIEEEMTFELPFSFPASKIKCKVESAEANTNVEITCKMPKVKKFLKFKDFVLQPRLIKKKSMEMLYIQKKTYQLSSEATCESYNKIKLKRAIARKSAHYTFLQIGRAPSSTTFTGLFFMALTKKTYTGTFTKISIDVTMTVQSQRRRNLQGSSPTTEKEDTIDCTPKITEGDSSTLDCGTGSDIPLSIELEDDTIGGAPDNIKVETNPSPNYTDTETLKNFNNLPSVNIINITSNNCPSTGKYVITGTILEDGKTLQNQDNITIPFETPDSSGLCAMNVNSKAVTINCENTEEFTAPDIITIAAQTIYDKNGNVSLFKFANDFSVGGFSCEISDNSLKNPFSKNYSLTPSSSGSTSGARYHFHKKSSGLSGGAIAGLVIACVAVVAIIAGVAVFLKKSSLSKPQEVATSVDNNSSINRLNLNNIN